MPETETQKNNVIDIEVMNQRLSGMREDQQMIWALQPYRRSDRQQWQTELRRQSVTQDLSADRQDNAIDFVTEAYSSPQPQSTDAKRERLMRLDHSTRDLVSREVSGNTSNHEPQKQAGGEIQVIEKAVAIHTPQDLQEGQRQRDEGKSIIRRPFNALQSVSGKREVSRQTNNLPVPRQVALDDPRSGAVMRPGELALVRKPSSHLTEKTTFRRF
jgi:hypothetical protein